MRRIAPARTTETAKYKRQLRTNRREEVLAFHQVIRSAEKANELQWKFGGSLLGGHHLARLRCGEKG